MSIDQISLVDYKVHQSTRAYSCQHMGERPAFQQKYFKFQMAQIFSNGSKSKPNVYILEKSIKENTYQSFEAPKNIEKRKKDHSLPRIQRAYILRFKAFFFTKKLHSKKIEVLGLHKSKQRISICTKAYSSEISSNRGTSNYFFTFN